jgi:hypothetical protein
VFVPTSCQIFGALRFAMGRCRDIEGHRL